MTAVWLALAIGLPVLYTWWLVVRVVRHLNRLLDAINDGGEHDPR